MEDDRVFVEKCQKGDTQAFGALYDRYVEKIYRFVYYKTFNKDATEDIVSATFLKAFEKIGSFKSDKGSFSSWLYAIARNAVVDYYRTKKTVVDIEDIFDLGQDERTEEKIDARDTVQKIEKYLHTLKPTQREIVMLRVWDELSYKEIAAVVGGSEDSVKMAFSRAIRTVRDTFGAKAAILVLCARFLQ